MSMMKLVGLDADHAGTFANLGTLPRVPVPELADTLVRFEQWCSPLLSAVEVEQTRRAIQAFSQPGGPGEALHAALCAYDRKAGVYSWLDEFWPARYLGRRTPVAINANFVFLFRDRPKSQIEKAAELVAAATDFKLRLDTQTLPPATLRGRPLCMTEYKYLFSTTRVPGRVRDTVNTPYSEQQPGPSPARHILVLHQGHMFRMQVVDADGEAYSLDDIETALIDLVATSTERVPLDRAAGYFTTLARADWADVRAELLSHDSRNHETLSHIEQALFCLCLDEAAPSNRLSATDELLQGDGANRWFDKSVSLVVLKDGSAGINCEHSGLDGTVVLELVDALHDEDRLAQLGVARGASRGEPDFSEITFVLDDRLQRHIRRAREDFTALADNTATAYFAFEAFGITRIKSLRISPDAFVQIAFQLAHFRTKGLIGATYESIATRHFERGRTEAMRVVTDEIVEFIRLMACNASVEAKRAALRLAAEQHIERAKACQAGQAPEQHLWQLLLIAEEQGEALGINQTELALFESPGWRKMRDDYLSTSSAPSDNVAMFGFGATSEQCIGIAYLPRADGIYSYLSTPTVVAEQMHTFAEQLAVALTDLETLLAEAGA